MRPRSGEAIRIGDRASRGARRGSWGSGRAPPIESDAHALARFARHPGTSTGPSDLTAARGGRPGVASLRRRASRRHGSRNRRDTAAWSRYQRGAIARGSVGGQAHDASAGSHGALEYPGFIDGWRGAGLDIVAGAGRVGGRPGASASCHTRSLGDRRGFGSRSHAPRSPVPIHSGEPGARGQDPGGTVVVSGAE